MTVSDNSSINRKELKWDNRRLVWYSGFSSLLFFAPILVHVRLQPELIKSIPLCNSWIHLFLALNAVNTLGLLELSSLLGPRRHTLTWQMCTVHCTSRAEVPGWGTCRRVAQSSWTPMQCRQTWLAGQSRTGGGWGREITEGQVLGIKGQEASPNESTQSPRPARIQMGSTGPIAELHQGILGGLEAVEPKNLSSSSSRDFLAAGSTRSCGNLARKWAEHFTE